MNENHTDFEFNYASFSLKPYTGSHGTSSMLLKDIINKLNDPELPSEKLIIDRHKKRKNAVKRELVMISSKIESKGIRCYGKIALIKKKSPLLWYGKDIVKEIEKEQNRPFIEVTNYSIHFCEDSDPVIMHEFNNEGPRLSDIEYYLRQIASENRLAKNIKSSIHLKTDYAKLDSEIRNVFGVTIKVKSAFLNRTNWLNELQGINNETGYKDIRLELFFKRKKDQNGNYERNILGTDFARTILSWIGKTHKNIHYLDDLKMKYQVGEDDDVVDLDFLKNKAVSILKVSLIDGKVIPKDLKFAISQEFQSYLDTGKTNTE